ncbi:MAG: ankyrin repeat domain-containing protein [Bdellovibrionales bacterium]|nr:ankyrin repeat domain-containing protein [Bdellovibrionales bacterium]
MSSFFSKIRSAVKKLNPEVERCGLLYLDAARGGQVGQLQSYLTVKKVDPNFFNKDEHQSALHLSVIGNHIDAVRFLLNAGVDPALIDHMGNTAFFYALENNFQTLIKILCEKNIELVNIPGQDEEPPLITALRVGQNKVALFLIDRGANLDIALQYVIDRNDEAQIIWLCERGANPNLIDSKGQAPLVRAILDGNLESLKFWLSRGADINFSGGNGILLRLKNWSPLMIAIDSKREEIAEHLLLQDGIDYSYATADGKCALTVALSMSQLKIIQMLADRGVDFNIRMPGGKTMLMVAAQSNNLAVVEAVYAQIPDALNAQDEIGWTALSYATKVLSPQIVQFLVDKGADLNLKTKDHSFDSLQIAQNQKASLGGQGLDAPARLDQIIKIIEAKY